MARKNQSTFVALADIQALADKISEKSASYISTSTAYRSRCDQAKKVELISKAKVVDMIGSWVQDIINANSQTTAMAEAKGQPQEADWQGTTDPELQDQAAGPVDVPSLQEDYRSA